jgi:hypothetical protein
LSVYILVYAIFLSIGVSILKISDDFGTTHCSTSSHFLIGDRSLSASFLSICVSSFASDFDLAAGSGSNTLTS